MSNIYIDSKIKRRMGEKYWKKSQRLKGFKNLSSKFKKIKFKPIPFKFKGVKKSTKKASEKSKNIKNQLIAMVLILSLIPIIIIGLINYNFEKKNMIITKVKKIIN